MKSLGSILGGSAFLILFILMQFPGGTVFMAIACPNQRLDGLDWVLSVVIPAYGLIQGGRCLL